MISQTMGWAGSDWVAKERVIYDLCTKVFMKIVSSTSVAYRTKVNYIRCVFSCTVSKTKLKFRANY